MTKSVRKPWRCPIGVLFGLGFDNPKDVGLLRVLAGGAAALSLPFYAILILPILFGHHQGCAMMGQPPTGYS